MKLFLHLYPVHGQDGCAPSLGALYGSPAWNERGKSMVFLPDQDRVLVFGMKDDSISVLHLDTKGRLTQVRTFIVIPGSPNHLSTACLDREGMIGLAGQAGSLVGGGQVFACRYDPQAGELLWAEAFTSYTPRNYSFTMVVNPVTDHYLMVNNPIVPGVTNNPELIELDRATGGLRAGMTGYYDLGVNETINRIRFHAGYAYGVGRFSYSASQGDMRNAVIKLDPVDGRVEWLRLGHLGRIGSARLYGADLDIQGDDIYSLYSGDPNGSTTTNTYAYVQRSGLEGSVLWVKQYDLPGAADIAHEMIPVGDDHIILAGSQQSGGSLFLLRIDPDGEVVWARDYRFPGRAVSGSIDRGTARLVMIGDSLWVTGTVMSVSGDSDMLVLRTDLQGIPGNSCVSTSLIPVAGVSLTDPEFVREYPTRYDSAVILSGRPTTVYPSITDFHPSCTEFVPQVYITTMTICHGDFYQGYAITGIYRDTFPTLGGCDSIRELHLSVLPAILSKVDTIVCPGQIVEGYSDPGVYVDTLTSVNGCDSIRTLSITHTLPWLMLEMNLCEGETYMGWAAPGLYRDTIRSAGTGCDTVFEVTLVAVPVSESWLEQTICLGEAFDGHSIAGTYTDTLVSRSGCDSIRHLELQVLEPLFDHVSSSVCDQESSHRDPGVYVDSLLSSVGCDSIVIREIKGLDIYLPNVFSPNQDGINDVMILDPGTNIRPEGVRFVVFDRWGDMLYETHQWPVQWDGMSRNGGVPGPGVYTFLLAYDCGGDRHVEQGTFTLLR